MLSDVYATSHHCVVLPVALHHSLCDAHLGKDTGFVSALLRFEQNHVHKFLCDINLH